MNVVVESIPPLTWVDVARRLAGILPGDVDLPRQIRRARVSWDALTLELSAPVSDKSKIVSWLRTLFPGRVTIDPLALALDGPAGADQLIVDFDEDPLQSEFRPSFGIVDGIIDFPQQEVQPLEAKARAVPLVAVQSVKGGTGRTTTAAAIALRWSSRANRPILLVDADLEAPGLSYLFREARGEPRISLEDAVVLAHEKQRPERQRQFALSDLHPTLVRAGIGSGRAYCVALRATSLAMGPGSRDAACAARGPG